MFHPRRLLWRCNLPGTPELASALLSSAPPRIRDASCWSGASVALASSIWTLFCCPKGFTGDAGAMQERAIQSWTQLQPRPEIILLGTEEGVARFAQAAGLRHVGAIQRNEYGTPLASSVFTSGQRAASGSIACYINADIVLLQDFADAIDAITTALPGRRFLALGGRWNLPEGQAWDPDDRSWACSLRRRLQRDGWLDDSIAMDYFVFPKEIEWHIPPFALGRRYWDSWLPWKAHSMRIPVIDLTGAVTAVHVQHGYDHVAGWMRALSPEVETNRRLLGFWRRYTIEDSTHVLVNSILRRRSGVRRWTVPWIRRFERMAVHYLRDAGIPGLHPVYRGLRTLKHAGRLSRPGHQDARDHPSGG